jgi:hypothetical protein
MSRHDILFLASVGSSIVVSAFLLAAALVDIMSGGVLHARIAVMKKLHRNRDRNDR